MPDEVHRSGQVEKLGDILLDEGECPMASQVGDVVDRSRDEIVDHNNPMAFSQEQVHEMGTEETSATRHQVGVLLTKMLN